MRVVEEVQQELDAQSKVVKMPQRLTDLASQRDAIYESYNTKAASPPEEETAEPESVKVEAEPKEKTEPEKAEFVKEDKPKDEEKTVPYGALKEEREKRKELSKKIKELEDSFRQAADDNKKLMDLMSDKSEEPITDYEKEMLSLRKQLKIAMNEIESFKKTTEKEREVSAEEKLKVQIDKTDAILSKDGFDGFNDFIPQVIKAMNDEDIPIEDRNPETWQRVYREIVYPKYIGKYKPTKSESAKAEKEELKKEASLVKSPGKAETKPREETTPQSYAKWRSSMSLFNNPL